MDSTAFRREFDTAEAAMRIMRAGSMKPEPMNYAVWYTYCAGDVVGLKAELDQYLKDKRPITADVSGQMFAKYIAQALAGLADQATRQKLDDANDRLGKTLNAVTNLVAAAVKGGEGFGAALDAFQREIGAVNDPTLATAVAAMIGEARKMVALNAELSNRLTQVSSDVAALKGDLTAIRQEAYNDGLTGIANRKAFNTRIDEMMAEAKANGAHLCLLMTDIDRFKSFNDTHGHLIGDQVIKVVARTLAHNVRDSDFAARYGGEEFAVLFPNTRLKDAIIVANKIRMAVRAKEMQNRRTGENLGRVTISIGVSEYTLGETVDDFIGRADNALYLAKQTGRDRVCSQLDLGKK
ncbi:MAG: GGDEF domain-containing protein [Rhodospirillaceae bacterium]|nr:GGDEF domain-containing protein [Rhodospirillaceae bacterium]